MRSMTASKRMLPSAGAAIARMGASCGELTNPPSALDTINGTLCTSKIDRRATSRACCRSLPGVHFDPLLGQPPRYEGGEGTESDRNRPASPADMLFRCRGCLQAKACNDDIMVAMSTGTGRCWRCKEHASG